MNKIPCLCGTMYKPEDGCGSYCSEKCANEIPDRIAEHFKKQEESERRWDQYFFQMIALVSSKSKDKSTQVGCVIVGPDKEVRSTGYNGFPRGVDDNIPERHERPAKYMWTEHAERNAIYNAAKVGIPINDCTMYADKPPCADCARAIVQSGISELVIDGAEYEETLAHLGDRWKEQIEIGIQILKEGEVSLRISEGDDIPRYKCLLCGRDKFTKKNQPHKCKDGFRKRGFKFERTKR